jgi:hypothetical protein
MTRNGRWSSGIGNHGVHRSPSYIKSFEIAIPVYCITNATNGYIAGPILFSRDNPWTGPGWPRRFDQSLWLVDRASIDSTRWAWLCMVLGLYSQGSCIDRDGLVSHSFRINNLPSTGQQAPEICRSPLVVPLPSVANSSSRPCVLDPDRLLLKSRDEDVYDASGLKLGST